MIITIIILLISSYTDLKTNEVPDYISYGFLFLVLGIRFIYALNYGWSYLLVGLYGFFVCLIIALILYYTSQWGGADSKLLMGMGAVIAIPYPLTRESFNLAIFIALLLFVGTIYGVTWMIKAAIKEKEKFVPEWRKSIHASPFLTIVLIFVTIVFSLLSIFHSKLWLPLIFFFLPLYYLIIFVKAVEQTCFRKDVNLNHLTLGDWLAESIEAGSLRIHKKTIEPADLEKIEKLSPSLKNTTVTIKQGIPFVPSFLLSYISLILFQHTSIIKSLIL